MCNKGGVACRSKGGQNQGGRTAAAYERARVMIHSSNKTNKDHREDWLVQVDAPRAGLHCLQCASLCCCGLLVES